MTLYLSLPPFILIRVYLVLIKVKFSLTDIGSVAVIDVGMLLLLHDIAAGCHEGGKQGQLVLAQCSLLLHQ